MTWKEVPYAHVPEGLEPDGEPGKDWQRRRNELKAEGWESRQYDEYLPGGSFAFAKDDKGNIWFIEWDPHGDECLYLKQSLSEKVTELETKRPKGEPARSLEPKTPERWGGKYVSREFMPT